MLAPLLLGCAPPVSDTGGAPLDEPSSDTGLAVSTEQVGPIIEEHAVTLTPVASVDVAIIGGGAAGMAAMIEAQSMGASALLIERDAQLGGSALYSGGSILFSGTPIQKDAGVADSPAVLLADWPGMTGGDPEAPWMVRYAEDNVPEVFDWLAGMGGTFTLSEEQSNGESLHRIHVFSGGGLNMIGILGARIPGSDVMLSAEATSLVLDDDGAVVGTLLEAGGETLYVEAGAVVVATGGFLRDLSLVSWAAPDLDTDAVWFSTGFDADGSGHHMLDALGADWAAPGAMGVYAHGVPDPFEDGEEFVMAGIHQGLWVNTDGEAFLDVVLTNSYATGAAVLSQPGHIAWAIFDTEHAPGDGDFLDPMVPEGETPATLTLDDLLDAGMAHEAESLVDLAALAGIDEAGLVETGSRLGKGPYTAVRIAPALAKNFGGIAVDERGAVVANGAAIPGLFAAGELTGMAGGSLVGDGGFTGSMSAVLLSGRVAGRSATE